MLQDFNLVKSTVKIYFYEQQIKFIWKLNSFDYMCKLNKNIILTTCYENKEININKWMKIKK